MFVRLIAGLGAFGSMLLSTGCDSGEPRPMTSTPALATVPSAASASNTPSPPETALSTTATAVVVPVDGVTITQVNVRLEPSTAGSVLGTIPAEMRVEITGKDPGGNWWLINYAHPEAVDGKAWVAAQYVTAPSGIDVPVVGGAPADPTSGSVAVVQEQINIRSGPGTGFNSLGTLNPQDVLLLTGKDPNGAWLQIDYEAGPQGRGWVNAAFVQAQGVENLPIIAESGVVIGTGTPTGVPPPPTATVIPAWEDNDTLSSPIVSVTLEPSGTQTFIYNGDLSAPQGDQEDWIAFQTSDRSVLVQLECSGSAAIEIQLLENGIPMNPSIGCGARMQALAVQAGTTYVLHLKAAPSAMTLHYTHYTLTIKTRP